MCSGLAACGLSACGAQDGSPAVKLMGQSAGPTAAGVSQHSTRMVTAKHTRLLCAAPGSFLRLASSKNITVEGGLPAATWREVQGLHPDVDLQDMGRHWMSLWIPVTELQVCEWSL